MGRLDIVNMTILPPNMNSMQSSSKHNKVFMEIDKLISNFIWKRKCTVIINRRTMMGVKTNDKTYYKSVPIKAD